MASGYSKGERPDADADIVAALLDFLRENEGYVLSSSGRYMRSGDGRPLVLDVLRAREELARHRGDAA